MRGKAREEAQADLPLDGAAGHGQRLRRAARFGWYHGGGL